MDESDVRLVFPLTRNNNNIDIESPLMHSWVVFVAGCDGGRSASSGGGGVGGRVFDDGDDGGLLHVWDGGRGWQPNQTNLTQCGPGPIVNVLWLYI